VKQGIDTNQETTTDVETIETPTETVAGAIATEVLEVVTSDLDQMSENATDTAIATAPTETVATYGESSEAVPPEETADVNSSTIEESSEAVVADESGITGEEEGVVADGAAEETAEAAATTDAEGEAAGQANTDEEDTASHVTGYNTELTAAIEVEGGAEITASSDDVPTHSITLEEATVDDTAEVDGHSVIENDDSIITIAAPTDDNDDLTAPSDEVVNSDGATPIPPTLLVPSDDVVNSDGLTPIPSPRLAKASETSITSNGDLEHELAQFSRDLEEPSLSSVDIDAVTPVNKSSASNRAANQEALLVEADELRRQVADLRARDNTSQKNLVTTDANLGAAERKVKDLQLRIIRSAKEDQEKDRTIANLERSVRDLNGELEVVRERGVVERGQAQPVAQAPPKSKSCVLL